MIFLINILNDQVTIIASKSKFPIFFFLGSFLEVLKHSIKKILLVLSFSREKKNSKTKNPMPSSSLPKTKIQFLCKFIYVYFLMFSNLGCS